MTELVQASSSESLPTHLSSIFSTFPWSAWVQTRPYDNLLSLLPIRFGSEYGGFEWDQVIDPTVRYGRWFVIDVRGIRLEKEEKEKVGRVNEEWSLFDAQSKFVFFKCVICV